MTSSNHFVHELVSRLRVISFSLQTLNPLPESYQLFHRVSNFLLLNQLLLFFILDLLFCPATLAAYLHQVATDTFTDYLERYMGQ